MVMFTPPDFQYQHFFERRLFVRLAALIPGEPQRTTALFLRLRSKILIGMKNTPSDLILTKLRPPMAHSKTIRRERLLGKLSREPGADLFLVCAPAGYGKTTLLADWAGMQVELGTAIAWYSLDESDNRPTAFGGYLVTTLEMALGMGSGLEPVRQVLRASVDLNLQDVLPTVINAVFSAGKDVALVLDDYHLITSTEIHSAVEFLVRHRPENLRLVIGSRANPALPLARLRAQGRLVELRTADLRFNQDETAQFLHDWMETEVPADLPGRLTELVEGWAVGLQLSALSLANKSTWPDSPEILTGQHRHLGEYLLEEVVNRLPEDMQSFLLFTALLERFSAPLCDAILQANDSANHIRRLEQANLFVTALDEQGIWFRYHHLLRDFLRAWLERTQPNRAKILHQAACAWFAGQGLLHEAADHAFRSGNLSFAADFVEQHSFTLIIQSDIATINEWCSAFPEAVMRQRPKLCVFQALALAYRFQEKHHERVNNWLRQAEQALATMTDPEQVSEIRELTGVVRTFMGMTPDPEPDIRVLQQMDQTSLDAYPPGDPGRFTWLLIAGYIHLIMGQCNEAESVFTQALPLALDIGLHFGYVETSFHLARLAHSRGRLDETLSCCNRAKATLTAVLQPLGIDLPAIGCLDVAAGSALLEQGRLDEAEQYLTQGLEHMGWGMNPYYLMCAYLAQFRLNEIRGRLTEAAAYLDQLDILWPDIQFLTQGYRLRTQLRRNPLDAELKQKAENWVQCFARDRGESFTPRGLGPLSASEAFYQADYIWLQLQMALGHSLPESFRLETQLEFANRHGLTSREIEWLLMEAQRLDKNGDERQSLSALERALVLGLPAGYLTIYCQNAALDDLIHRAACRGLRPAGMDRLLNTIRAMRHEETGTGLTPARSDSELSSLSEREREILRIIAAGASNQEIADQLVITVGTVKGHINHILGKLDVTNRTEAVAKARKLGLVD